MSESVPVLILTGYLGAGKTTVLNHLLATAHARIGVVINDFGDVNVDAALVAGQVAEPVSIAGGCLCCIDDPRQLDDALRALARPGLDLDAVVIEGSGLAEPPALIQLVLASEVPGIRFGGLVEVVAAAHVAHAESGGWDLEQHVKAAAVVLLTKSDIAPPEELARTRERILAANPHTTVLDAPHGAVDPALFFDAAKHTVPEGAQLPLWEIGEAPGEHGHHGHEHHVHHRAVSLDVPAAVDPAALADLLEDPPASVHRVKAIADVATPSGLRRFVAHSVAGYVTVERARRPAGEPPHSVVVAIGPDDVASSPVDLGALPAAEGDPAPSSPQLRRLTRFL